MTFEDAVDALRRSGMPSLPWGVESLGYSGAENDFLSHYVDAYAPDDGDVRVAMGWHRETLEAIVAVCNAAPALASLVTAARAAQALQESLPNRLGTNLNSVRDEAKAIQVALFAALARLDAPDSGAERKHEYDPMIEHEDEMK